MPKKPDFDAIDRTSADSFPASDPPGWASGRERSDLAKQTANRRQTSRRPVRVSPNSAGAAEEPGRERDADESAPAGGNDPTD